MREAVGRRHHKRRIGFREAELAEDEAVLIEGSDHVVALQLATRLEMCVVILVEAAAMYPG